jgi:hypothetical protein
MMHHASYVIWQISNRSYEFIVEVHVTSLIRQSEANLCATSHIQLFALCFAKQAIHKFRSFEGAKKVIARRVSQRMSGRFTETVVSVDHLTFAGIDFPQTPIALIPDSEVPPASITEGVGLPLLLDSG